MDEKTAKMLCEDAGVEFSKPARMNWDGDGWSNDRGEVVSLPVGAIFLLNEGWSPDNRIKLEGELLEKFENN